MLKIKRTTARFGKVNPRVESHGKDKVQASDVVVTIPLSAELLGDLVMDRRLAEYLHTPDGRVAVPAVSPLAIHRTIEGCNVTVWDNPEKPLELSEVTLKDPTVTLLPNKSMELHVKLQMKWGRGQLERFAALMQGTADIEIEATQNDMFEDSGKQSAGKRKQAPEAGGKSEPKKGSKKKAVAKKTAAKLH